VKKIYSLKKEVVFKTNIYDILSIALDKKFSIDGYAIKGQFIINGEYLIRENESDDFNIDIPYLNYIEDTYDISKIKIDVDDFYYEIKDSNKLVINIDIVVDGLEEVERICEYEEEELDIVDKLELELEEEMPVKEIPTKEIPTKEIPTKEIETNVVYQKENTDMEIKKNYTTYRVYIVRDGDTIQDIVERYSVSIELLKEYNVINDIKVGDKIIIPYEKNK